MEERNGGANSFPSAGQADPSAQIAAAAKALIAAGYSPTHAYALWVGDTGWVCARTSAGGGSALLFFSAPILAVEYSKVMQIDAGLRQIDVSKFPEIATHAEARGATGFILNRCPRCDEAMLVPLESLKTIENVRAIWALNGAMRNWRLSQAANTAFTNARHGKISEIVPPLSYARDHVDASSPLLHYLLALASLSELPGAGASLLAESREALVSIGRPDLVKTMKTGMKEATAELLLLLYQASQGNWTPPASEAPGRRRRAAPL
ncbi:MAG: hypothetical protein ACJ746_04220 [Bryobacteraceae bacterium]